MDADKIKTKLIENLHLQEAYVSIQYDHCRIIAIDKIFFGKSVVEQHKIIYAPIMKDIADNKIHSVSIHAFCPEEWDICKHLYKIE